MGAEGQRVLPKRPPSLVAVVRRSDLSSVVPPRTLHRSCNRLTPRQLTTSLVATDLAPQPVANKATAASRRSSDNELVPTHKLLPLSQN
jgi:hypothetical protein